MTSRKFFHLAAVCLVILLALTSCDGDDPASSSDPCHGNCLPTQVCDQGQCVACTSNAHCTSAAAPICRLADNICVQCAQDSQCGSGLVCDNAQCVADEGGGNCESDADCEGSDVCIAGACQICRLGTCNEAGDSRCQSETIGGDTSWALCASGSCASGACQDVQECEPGSCHTGTARCSNAGQIEECGIGEICQKNVCKDSFSEYDCTPNQCASTDASCSSSGEIIDCGSGQSCSDNACVSNCGNGRIDNGEDCDGSNLNGKACATLSAYAFTGGELSCSPTCTFDTSACSVAGGIAAAREAAKAAGSTATAVEIQITDAVATYVRAAIGQDEAGFFLQASPTGPAIFVNASGGNASPAIGDKISLTATEVVLDEVCRISKYSNYSREASNINIAANYIQDVSKAKDIDDIDSYESEIIEALVTLTGAFGSIGNAGTGFQKAPIMTQGYTPTEPSRDFVLRVPEAIANEIAAEAAKLSKKLVGCQVYFDQGIYWAYMTSRYSDTQLTIYDPNANYVMDCDGAEDLPEIPTTWDYTETFDSIETIADDYTTENSWVSDGISWNVVGRTEMIQEPNDYSINGQGVILRGTANNTAILASGLTRGIGQIAFEHRMWSGTTAVSIEVFDSVGKSLGTHVSENISGSEVGTFNVNIGNAGIASFKITNSNKNRIIIDDVRWTNAQ